MRIAFDARMIGDEFSGIRQYSLNILETLAELDRQNEYLLIIRDDRERGLPSSFQKLKFNHYPFSLDTLYRLRIKLENQSIDIFHSPFNICPLNLHCKMIVTVHDIMPLLFPYIFQGRNRLIQIYARMFFKAALRKSLRRADRILSDSSNTGKDIAGFNLAAPEKIRICYPAEGMKRGDFASQTPVLRKEIQKRSTILSLGSTKPHKNWIRLIGAYKMLRHTNPGATLVLVCSDDRNLASIKSLIKELAFEPETIRILGHQTQEELTRLYHSADLFVFPSLYEGFGMPPLEAMSCGVSVVASDRGSLPEVLGDAAFYVNPEDEKDIARGMKVVLEDANLRHTLINRGYGQVKKYSWEKTARQILSIYEEVYQEGRK
jgi:glycosyltransferase involved in cell wall biosynthesis